MNIKEFRNLKRGDVVRNLGSGDSYVIDFCYELGATFIGVNTICITNPSEWTLDVPEPSNLVRAATAIVEQYESMPDGVLGKGFVNGHFIELKEALAALKAKAQ